ncbi:hypothetical protein LCGC14_0893240 [marine sediment metagenome]|uniref:Uncharacterized protein n=1 Tax=marine sediment metagenome TaxID=412755 RepID=A0A0F9RHT9_9ZZZZ
MGKIKLSSEKVAKLKIEQRNLHDILPDIDALEQCGADCTIPREQYIIAQDRIANILRLFGSGHDEKAQQ